MSEIELTPEKVVAGGEALARDADGRVVLVEGAIPGERVRVEIHNAKKKFARGRIVEVLAASPDRVSPPCPHVAAGCGGCDWQHIEPAAQRRLRRDIVVDALARLGKIDDADGLVAESVALPDANFRTSVRVLMVKGRPAFRKAYSHDPVLIDSCLVAHPLIESLLADAQFDAVKEAEIRCGTRTGERLVIAFPTTRYLSLPDDVVMIGADDIEAGKTAMFAEEAAGRRWRISATSFFQTRADGADALAQLVKDAVPDDAETVVDLYCGVGLFAGTVARKGRKVIAVEGNPAAVRDAKHNLASDDVKVDRADISRWDAVPADVVIADPSRAGLGADVVSHIGATDAGRVIMVACDAAALGRDVRLLTEAGYSLTSATPVDLFPHTSHVEVVAVLDR
ncbi:MAG: class I SAM-dependent RNA methyltransferase [Acidimicrobiia bacterium]|nr:class I SAM-dependent RNA methyltransferase [Acidimicrobiia bacterium]